MVNDSCFVGSLDGGADDSLAWGDAFDGDAAGEFPEPPLLDEHAVNTRDIANIVVHNPYFFFKTYQLPFRLINCV